MGDRGSGIGDRGSGIGDRGSGIGDRGSGIGDWGLGMWRTRGLLLLVIPAKAGIQGFIAT
ncbi:hypothetical protein LEN_0368 [Lysobacter enzymogenes]|uniref:Uncharacterized protein n=1 Tax=Lysobacter enzymogenes TaxID=69 RepID=A0AAU9AJL6_LYSEN|nr:hypothetical protein LEN_0368 [Lysobacter enzymogenes]